jgi:hypothetical protein
MGGDMRTTTAENTLRVVAFCGAVLAFMSTGVSAQQKTYEGDIISVDGKANVFTVKGTRPGEAVEMAFHVGPKSEVMIGAERSIFAELVKGDHVTVEYGTAGNVNTVNHAARVRTAAREMTFAGNVVAVDLKAQTFTAKATIGGKVEEMEFHVSPTTKLYVGGEEEHLLADLRVGDAVRVGYEPGDAKSHNVKHVAKG